MADAAGVVLTGGRSRRMGRDKAFLDWEGGALVLRPIQALRDAGLDPVVAVGGDLDRLRDLGVDAVDDPRQGGGPLAGIVTALEVVGTHAVVVLACDMPDASPVGVRRVLEGLGRHDVAVPVLAGRFEPLHAAWRTACLPIVAAVADRGGAAVQAAFDVLDTVRVEGLEPAWLRNINRPEDTLGR